MTLTLASLAAALETSEAPATSTLKNALLRDTRPGTPDLGVLTLSTPADVAHLLAIGLVLASETNGKDALLALKAEYSGAELTEKFQACSNANSFQSLKTAKGGEFVLDAKNLPMFELDAKKVSPLLTHPEKTFRAAASLNLGQLASSTAFQEAFASRVSHPTKLSAPAGKGGFLKSVRVELPADFQCVTEEDFLTRETVTLSCSASYQKLWSVLLPLFKYEGQPYRLASFLFERADLAPAVSQVLAENGVEQGPLVVAALSSPPVSKLWGEPQVFCGDLPNVERLSVMAPYGLFNEISRAKLALKADTEAESTAAAEALQADIDALESRIKALDANDKSKEEKKATQLEKATLSERLKEMKAYKKRLLATWLNIPCFPLMFGGAVPRNVAMDLDTALHSANVQVRIPAARKVVSALSGKAFRPTSLVVVPKLRGPRPLPRFLSAATGAGLKTARQSFFADLISQAMAPLKLMQEEWQTRAKELTGEVALSARAQAQLDSATGPWALFIKGDEALNNKAAMAELQPVVVAVTKAVREALQNAFGDAMPSTFDAELLDLANSAVAIEKA